MSELSRQQAIAEALADVFQAGSILINDYATPQTASRKRAPWAILAIGDDFLAAPGDSWETPTAQWRVFLTLLDYRAGRTEVETLNAFQALRQSTIAALLTVPYLVDHIEAQTTVGPYFTEEGEPDPDSIAQALVVHITDYEV